MHTFICTCVHVHMHSHKLEDAVHLHLAPSAQFGHSELCHLNIYSGTWCVFDPGNFFTDLPTVFKHQSHLTKQWQSELLSPKGKLTVGTWLEREQGPRWIVTLYKHWVTWGLPPVIRTLLPLLPATRSSSSESVLLLWNRLCVLHNR